MQAVKMARTQPAAGSPPQDKALTIGSNLKAEHVGTARATEHEQPVLVEEAESSQEEEATDAGREGEEGDGTTESGSEEEVVEEDAALTALRLKIERDLAVRAPKLVNTRVEGQSSLVIPPPRSTHPWEHRKIYSRKLP